MGRLAIIVSYSCPSLMIVGAFSVIVQLRRLIVCSTSPKLQPGPSFPCVWWLVAVCNCNHANQQKPLMALAFVNISCHFQQVLVSSLKMNSWPSHCEIFFRVKKIIPDNFHTMKKRCFQFYKILCTLANLSHKPKDGKSEIFGISFLVT